jgi:hypothetical protein
MGADCDLASFTRRGLLTAGVLTAVSSALAPLPAWSQSPPANAISPDEAIERLRQGNARYVNNKPSNRDFSAGRIARAQAQYRGRIRYRDREDNAGLRRHRWPAGPAKTVDSFLPEQVRRLCQTASVPIYAARERPPHRHAALPDPPALYRETHQRRLRRL